MQAPDYESYSLAELHEAYDHLDKDAHPERAALLSQYIRNREEEELDTINGIERHKLARRRERFAAFLIDLLIAIVSGIPLWVYYGLDRLQQPLGGGEVQRGALVVIALVDGHLRIYGGDIGEM